MLRSLSLPRETVPPKGRAVPPKCFALRLPHSPAPPVAFAILDPARFSRPAASSFTLPKEMTVIYVLEITIEELRAELRHCDAGERDQIQAELEQAYAELEVIVAELEGRVSSEPPF